MQCRRTGAHGEREVFSLITGALRAAALGPKGAKQALRRQSAIRSQERAAITLQCAVRRKAAMKKVKAIRLVITGVSPKHRGS